MTDYAITYEVEFGEDGIEAEEDLYTHIILKESKDFVNGVEKDQNDILILPAGYQKIELNDTELDKEYVLLRKTDDKSSLV